MPRFLSPAWLERLAASAGGVSVDPSCRLTLRQVVTCTPDGDVRYTVRVAEGRIEVDGSGAVDPDVTFTSDWPTASAMSRGELAAQDAFMAGRLRLGGDVAALLAHAPALAALDDAYAELRAATTYD